MIRQQFVIKKQPKKSPLSFLSLKSFLIGSEPDYGLILSMLGLLVFGWVMVYSSSALFAENKYHDQYYFLKRQVAWSFLGLVFFVMASNLPMSFWQRHTKKIYFLTAAVLILVLFIGPQIAGAKRWLRFGFVGVQPSELAKLALVLSVADYLDRRQSRIREFKKGLLPLLLSCGVILGLIFIEPDLGTPALISLVIFFLLILGGARFLHLFGLLSLFFVVMGFAVVFVRYRMERLFSYLNPWADPYGRGYQLVQSLLALGSGGILGRGLGNSKIKLSHLPDAHTDFIFSVIGEELGLIGTLFCAFLFLFICLRGLRVSRQAGSYFAVLVGTGLSLMLGFQALINMGVASGLFPTKGMPLPFLSFGGSSLVMNLLSIGILTQISKMARSQPAGDTT